MAAYDFSFPATAETFPGGVDSPPLWNLSPVASPLHYHSDIETCGFRGKSKMQHKEDEDEDDCFDPDPLISRRQRKSFSYIQNCPKRVPDCYDHDGDNKMDSLWEDFNEELSSRTGSEISSSKDSIELGCLQSLAISKTGRLPTKNKHSKIVIVKVLKKLLLLHNPQWKLKKQRY